VASVAEPPAERKDKKTSSAAFKQVPQERGDRDRVRAEAARLAAKFDRSRPLERRVVQAVAEAMLAELGLAEGYLGFAMVCLSNEFWRDQIQAIPFHRRLLLLPHCLKHAEGCPADYDEFGLDCKKCGACDVADFKTKAEELGYKVLVSEGTPIVLKIIVSGHVDAIVGVACLNVLEKAFDKMLLAGIPGVAAPLLSSNCRSTSVDDDWVFELINLQTPPTPVKTRSYLPLMRAAHALCEEPELSRLAPRARSAAGTKDPLGQHEQIAYDWLGEGGKRSRPFITLAIYDALTGGGATLADGPVELPDSVRRVALSIEAFHKASLVHDDIEDDDSHRYGKETLHRRYNVGVAINVGDYLLGLGYRLIGREKPTLGGDCTADILNRLADAHLKLSEGQGAELLWRDATDKTLTALDALKIYALKTSPAFEAALYAGVRLAGPAEPYEKLVTEFSKNLGIAFQILNDLKDWTGDDDNKMVSGQDVLAGRPTLLLALALEGLPAAERTELVALLHRREAAESDVIERVRRLFTQAGVFDKAGKLVEKFRAKSEALADAVENEDLRRLLYYLVDSVLDGTPAAPEPPLQLLSLPVTVSK